MSVTIGFIGSGAIAREHAAALARIDGARVVAWCDVSLDAARAGLDAFGGDYATTDAQRLIDDDAIDVLYICTWHDSHAPLVERACRHARPIVLEKPMAITRTDLDRIVDAVERSGVLLMMAFKLRFYPLVRRIRSHVPSPLLLTGHVRDNRWPDEFWAQDAVTGGGNVLSQGPHAFDLLCHLAGSAPVRVLAEGGSFTHPGSGLVDTLAATIRFANGAIASVVIGDSGLTTASSKFAFSVADGRHTAELHDRLRRCTFFDGERSWIERDDEELGMLEENRAFIDAVRGVAPAPTSHRDGYTASLLALEAIESARTGLARMLTL